MVECDGGGFETGSVSVWLSDAGRGGAKGAFRPKKRGVVNMATSISAGAQQKADHCSASSRKG